MKLPDPAELKASWRSFLQAHPSCEKPVSYLLDEAERFTAEKNEWVVERTLNDLETLRTWGERPTTEQPPPAALPRPRNPGELVTLRAYDVPGDYASFPNIVRTDTHLALSFRVQPVPILRGWRLKDWKWHPHGQHFAVPTWVTSADGGTTWRSTRQRPSLGHLRHVTRSLEGLADDPGAAANLQRDIGGRGKFYVFDFARCADGTILAAGRDEYADRPGAHTTALFARSEDGGRKWTHCATIPNPNPWSYSEPALYVGQDGHITCILRAEWRLPVPEDVHPDGRNKHDLEPDGREPGYGFYFYQSLSRNHGQTWTEPERLPIWGHPAYMIRLHSGNVLMVYGHRKAPWTIRAILSRDDGLTWDQNSIRTLHEFNPSLTDFGYPVATQCDDGTIVCAFYGYAGEDITPWGTDHAVFATLFDEPWLNS